MVSDESDEVLFASRRRGPTPRGRVAKVVFSRKCILRALSFYECEFGEKSHVAVRAGR